MSLQKLFKSKGEGRFGTLEERISKTKELRKKSRHDFMFEKRKIPTQVEKTASKRLELLAKWKAEKQKRKMEEKKNAKPAFKVTHVSDFFRVNPLSAVDKKRTK